ncbi:hypothetical protein Tco_1006218 [Tanacetum coccineum]|uniref:Uncharacterized protein n=1 Tax=Tanacetum coccineum TaxID=301880 RepID=A0ABQ5FI99_9ASTR
MYKEYLAEFWYSTKALENSKVSFLIPTCGIYGEVGVNTFRNATGSHYLPYSSEYVAPPSIDIVRPRFETIGYGETVPAKGTLKKSLLPPRWRLLMAQIIQCLGVKLELSQWYLKLPKPLPILRGFLKAQSPELKLDTRSIQLLQNNPLYLVERQQKVGLPKHLLAPKLATGGPNSLGVASEERADPQLSSGMLAFNLNKHIHSASFINHSESALGNDTLAYSTAEADPGKSAPSDFISQQQGMNEGTNNTLYDHLFASTDPHVLADQTQSVIEGLETVLTPSTKDKGAGNIAKQITEEEA